MAISDAICRGADGSLLRPLYRDFPAPQPMGKRAIAYGVSLGWLVAGALSTGLLGGLLLLGTGHAFRLEKLAQQLGESESRIAADLLDMTRLHQVSDHLMQKGAQIEKSLDKVIEAAVAISETKRGYIQFLNPATGALMVAAQRGLNESFLKLVNKCGKRRMWTRPIA